jgi:hypothetical protein
LLYNLNHIKLDYGVHVGAQTLLIVIWERL